MTEPVQMHPIEEIHVGEGWVSPFSEFEIRETAIRIRQHGFEKPVVVDDRGRILSGHLTWLAAQWLNLQYLPVRRSHLRVVQ